MKRPSRISGSGTLHQLGDVLRVGRYLHYWKGYNDCVRRGCLIRFDGGTAVRIRHTLTPSFEPQRHV
jgi:hypothetical protein